MLLMTQEAGRRNAILSRRNNFLRENRGPPSEACEVPTVFGGAPSIISSGSTAVYYEQAIRFNREIFINDTIRRHANICYIS